MIVYDAQIKFNCTSIVHVLLTYSYDQTRWQCLNQHPQDATCVVGYSLLRQSSSSECAPLRTTDSHLVWMDCVVNWIICKKTCVPSRTVLHDLLLCVSLFQLQVELKLGQYTQKIRHQFQTYKPRRRISKFQVWSVVNSSKTYRRFPLVQKWRMDGITRK